MVAHLISRRRLLILALACTVLVAMRDAPLGAQRPNATTALLRAGDLPAGWSETPDGSGDDGVIVDNCVDGAPIRPSDFAQTSFEGGTDGPYLLHAVRVFAAGNAERAMAYLRREFDNCVIPDTGQFEFRNVPLTSPPLGDESLALLIMSKEPGPTFLGEVLIVRRDDAMFILRQYGDGMTFQAPLFERVSPIADDRLRQLVDGLNASGR